MKCNKHKSFTERRKILEQIPEGQYCYTIIGKSDRGGYKIKSCPYWKGIGQYMAKCTLYNVKDKYPQDLLLLWDQVKYCELKKSKNRIEDKPKIKS